MPRESEGPCPKTGKQCRWIYCCEICSECYCGDCYRIKDYDLEPYPEDEEKILARSKAPGSGGCDGSVVTPPVTVVPNGGIE